MTASCHAKMLRYFCILSLLVCIHQAFCYDYVYETNSRRGDRRPVKKIRIRTNHQGNVAGRRKAHGEYEEDRNPAAKFDVASFIQKPDDEAVQEYSFEDKDSSRQSKEYNDYGSLTDANNEEYLKKREKSQDYFNVRADNTPDLNLGSPVYKELMNPRHSNLNTLSLGNLNGGKVVQSRDSKPYPNEQIPDTRPLHTAEKKCSLKSIKFPFFSRNKSDNAKTKNNKKRKMFSKCPKKEDENQIEPQKPNSHYRVSDNMDGDLYKVSDSMDSGSKLSKRSYQERLCPACKKIYIANVNRRSVNRRRFFYPKKLFHNSRQAQNVNAISNEKLSEVKSPKEASAYNEFAYEANGSRRRREEATEKQFKEIQEVEKRVDNTETTVPNNPKVTASN